MLALAGPLSWMVWNRVAHGDALHFLARVAAYRQALGATDGAAGRLWAYPVAMVREEPEVMALLLGGMVVCGVRRLERFARPAALLAAQIAALSLAMIKDGAPTHHPERAVLAALLVSATAGGALFVEALRARVWWKTGMLVGAVAIGALVGRGGAREGFVKRGDEVAIGEAAASMVGPGERVLVEVVDYGHLAVTAALGRPEDVEPDRSVDPRLAKRASSFGEAEALRERIAGMKWVIARPSEVTRAVLGEPRATRGAWAVFAVGGGT